METGLGAGLALGLLFAYLVIRPIIVHRARRQMQKTKDEFIGLSSHYLLTPISIIQGALAKLQEQESTLKVEDRQKLYGNIEKGQQRLWILAEQFVLVSQIEQGALKLKLEAGSVSDAVQGALATMDIFAREKGVHLEFKDSTKTLQQARFDHRRFKQALLAIVDNAIKFSPQGATVKVTVIQEPHSFAIEVNDVGPGMSSDAVRTATQAFARGTSSYTFDHEGIGLGLYTANSIIREHGGELRFDTQNKGGTTITLRFPSE